MLANLEDIDTLLSNIEPQQSAIGALKLVCLEEGYKPRMGEIFACDAFWNTRTDPKTAARRGPRHQTLRRRGSAPPYPRPIDLTRGTAGRLVMLREGLALEPTDVRQPSTYISVGNIRRVSFFSDCIKVIHNDAERTLIRCDVVETLDLLFEAHF